MQVTLALSFSPQPWTGPGVQTLVGGLARVPALVPGLPEGTSGLLGLASQGLGRPVPAWNPGGSGDADPGKFAPRGLYHVASFSGFFLVWVVFTVKATLTFLHHPPRVQARVLVSGLVPPRGPRKPEPTLGLRSRSWRAWVSFWWHSAPCRPCPPLHFVALGRRVGSTRRTWDSSAQSPGVRVGAGDAESLTPSPSCPAGRAGLRLALRFAGSCLPWSPWLPISRLALLLAPEYAAGQRHVLPKGERVGAGSPRCTAHLGSVPQVTALTCASWPRVSPEEGVHPYAEVMIEPRDHARLKTKIHPNKRKETLETSGWRWFPWLVGFARRWKRSGRRFCFWSSVELWVVGFHSQPPPPSPRPGTGEFRANPPLELAWDDTVFPEPLALEFGSCHGDVI